MSEIGGDTRSQTIDQELLDANRAEMQRVLATAVDLHKQGKLEQAEQLYRALIGIDPQHADALHLLGVIANQSGNNASAVTLFQRAIATRPDVPQFHFNLGVVLQALELNQEAVRAYERAVQLQPDYREALENLGVARQDSGDDTGAVGAYRLALELDSDAAIANRNLGTLLLSRGETETATWHFEKALQKNPAMPDVHWKLAAAFLQAGNYGRGWDEYEWRYCSGPFVATNPPAFAPYPKWTGSSLADKTILITREQGIGDEVLFASCFDDVITRARHCVIDCDPRLANIFRRSFPAASVVTNGTSHNKIDIDCRISAGSLPRLLRREAADFPASGRYLWCDPERALAWRTWLAGRDDNLKVGISWRGGLKPRAREARSTDLEAWRDLMSAEGASFFSIQYGDHATEIAEFNARGGPQLNVPEGLDPLDNIDDLAAFIGALDLVITIDNSNTHFAAALGAPTWVLLPASPEWRWRTEDGHNKWFPRLEQFPQSMRTAGDWRPVFSELAERLGRAVAAPRTARDLESQPALVELDASTRRAAPDVAGRDVLLINDTTDWYHFGCTATSLAIHDRLRDAGHSVTSLPIRRVVDLSTLPSSEEDFESSELFDSFAAANPDVIGRIEDADLVYVNGEGTLHRLGHQALALLYLISIASRRLGKSVRVINHSCYPEGDATSTAGAASRIYRRVYEGLEYIAVRERTSATLLRGMGLQVADSFDCLPLYVDRLHDAGTADDSPYLVIAGGVAWRHESVSGLAQLVKHARDQGLGVKLLTGANAYPAGDEQGFAEAAWQACEQSIEVVFATSEAHWLDVIAGARLLVSGRFHHSIAAAFLGTPFIVSESNTPKIDGLLDMLQLDAMLALPADWSRGNAARYAARLLDRASLYLDRPDACTLKSNVREQLITASLRNFDEPD